MRVHPQLTRALALLLIVFCLHACGRSPASDTPTLVVMIVVDQLRADLLTRYEDLFTGGFCRLLEGGHRFESAFHEHAITNTAPGHATLASGVYPSRHGIVDNNWLEKLDDGGVVRVYSVADTTSYIVGRPDARGASPHKLLEATLADWMQQSNPATQVVSIAGKDRSAVLMAGQVPGHVYWFSSDDGRFVTSSWYRASDPDWLDTFHAEVLPQFCADSVWVSSVPEAARSRTRPDSTAYENRRGLGHFPHRLQDNFGYERNDGPKAYFEWMQRTPFVDAAILALGQHAVSALQLGADDSPDLLALGLSQADYIGHRFGPLSQEQLDNLLRLDDALETFFDFLDDSVGVGRYVVGLSADHGVCSMTEHLQAMGEPALRVTSDQVDAVLDAVVDAVVDDAVEVSVSGIDAGHRSRRVADIVESFDFVADAMTHAELAATTAVDSMTALYRHSHRPDRIPTTPLYSRKHRNATGSFGVEARLKPYHVPSEVSAVHGSPYSYDRHVPLIFMGARVPAGTTYERARTLDFAPTLARLCGVEAPPGLDGEPLEAALGGLR